MLKKIGLVGNTDYGQQTAQTVSLGAQALKQRDSFSSRSFVGNGKVYQSPNMGLAGEVSVPNTIPPPAFIDPIVVSTEGETEDVNFTLFDVNNLYRSQSCMTGCTAGTTSSTGCIYVGSKTCNRYDSLVSMLCSSDYVCAGMKIFLSKTDGGGGSTGALARNLIISIWKGNIGGDQQVSRLPLALSYNENAFDQDVLNVSFTDQRGVLDKYTAWNFTLPKETEMSIWLLPALRS